MTQVQTKPTPACNVIVKQQWCKGCNLCVNTCPKGVLDLDHLTKIQIIKPEACTGCGLCESTCPDFAIRVKKNA